MSVRKVRPSSARSYAVTASIVARASVSAAA